MKAYSFLVTLSLAIVLVNAFSTEEHVKRFFRPEHRSLLPEVTSLQLQDEPALVPQNDESTKCLAHCEPQCERVKVPDFLQVTITPLCFNSGLTTLNLKSLRSILPMHTFLMPHLSTYYRAKVCCHLMPNLSWFFPYFTEIRKLPQIWRRTNQLRVSLNCCVPKETQVPMSVYVPVSVRLLPSM